jgi:hypothetical protein
MTQAKENGYEITGVQGFRWDGVSLNQQANILYIFSMGRGMIFMNWVQVFLYIRESYQQLKG